MRFLERDFVSCGKMLRWRQNVIEQKCSKCGRYCIKWSDVLQYDFCPNCGEKNDFGTCIEDFGGDKIEKEMD